MKDRIRWEVQWHPINGARIRCLVFTWRGAQRLMLDLGIAGLVVVAGGLLAGHDGLLTCFAVNTVVRENAELKAQQDALRERAFDLAEQLYGRVEQGRKMIWMAHTPGHAWEGHCTRSPARDAGNEAILAWLSEQGTRLEAIGNHLAAGRVEMDVKQASVPAPASRGTMPVRHAAVLQVADMESARRQEAALARR